jgi:GST-like protein
VFDSNAILLYLADKTGRFAGRPERRGDLLSWLMFVATGVGPYSGQAVHFQRFAPEQLPYAVNRYVKEAERHYGILDQRLADGRPFVLGDEYTIVDMAAWGWVNALPFVLGPDGSAAYPNLKRWHEAVSARPAAARAQALKEGLKLKTEFDEEARRAMFPQNVAAAA